MIDPTAPRYGIDTLVAMAAIPKEARGRFLAELPSILDYMAGFEVNLKAANLSLAAEQTIRLASTPQWIDDGETLRQFTVKLGDEVIFQGDLS